MTIIKEEGRNGTFLVITQVDESNWSVLSILMPKFISGNKGFLLLFENF